MTGLPLLSILIALPLVAGALCLFVKENGARWVALIATLIEFGLSIYLWANYDPNGPRWQFVETMPLGGGVNWAVGIDGIALVLIALTAFPDDDNRQASLRLGATHFLEKPVALERIAELASQAGVPTAMTPRALEGHAA